MRAGASRTLPGIALLLAVSGCTVDEADPARDRAAPSRTGQVTRTPPAPPAPTASAAPTTAPTRAQTENPEAGPRPSDGLPRLARLSIPRLGIRDLTVVPYRGRPDDGPGTRIQNGGVAASPHGPAGGTGPGGLGNYIVTAHRLSSTQAFLELPRLRKGDRVTVVAGGRRYVYQIMTTRSTSFRSPASLARQAAAVPGRPGVPPTRAMITLSTCATPEDHAAGNYWSDEFGNPEHRIDKIGVLVGASPGG